MANIYTSPTPSITDTAATIIWTNWVIAANSTSTAITCNAWNNWVIRAGNVSAATTAGTAAWIRWNNDFDHDVIRWQQEAQRVRPNTPAGRGVIGGAPNIVSEETRRALRAQQEEHDRLMAAERELRRAAEAKAEILLKSILNHEQEQDLKTRGHFFVYSQGKKYRVDRGQHGNVKLVNEKDEVLESYCIQPRGGIPDADAMAAQKLLLETDPETFRRIANISDRRGFLIRRGEGLQLGVG